MTSLLELSVVREHVHRLSVEDYLSQQTLTERDTLRSAALPQIEISVRDILPA
jgi:hypothetical protein